MTLAVLNLAGNQCGRILSWVFQPLVVLGNVAIVAIVASQRAAAQVLESVFEPSGDATLGGIDVHRLLDAAGGAFPAWLPHLVNARNAVVTLGSLPVIVLLATPSAMAASRPAATRRSNRMASTSAGSTTSRSPGGRPSTSPPPIARRSREARACKALAPPAGGRSSQIAAVSASADTTRPGSIASRASSARTLVPEISI